MNFWLMLFAFCALLGDGKTPSQFEKQADGVLFEIKKEKGTDPRWIKVQVCAEDIIRVIAAPAKFFSTRPSLMVDKRSWAAVPWWLNEKGDWVEISTSKLIVRVRPKSGAVAFYDAKGKLLLQEKAVGGKIITPAEVMGERTFHIQQLFDSPENEAFYGLGAHQNAVMNYKGHDVDLWQYNIVDVIPFLVSSKNYGILWDNNSHTKFGDIREYQSLSTLTLYGKDGAEGGLTAEYFKDPDFQSLFATRPEPRIEHEFDDVNDEFPEGFRQNVAAVRWSGEIESRETGMHKFRLYSCGYTKMWLNGKLVVDSWRQNWLPWTNLLSLEMVAGEKYQIRIEWVHTGGYIGLKCLTPEDRVYQSSLSLYSEVADQIDYYFIHRGDLDQVIRGYREITGKAPMMPKWAMGLWQCRERYRTQEELLSVVKEFRKRQIPLDNIVQDWFYWNEDQWGSHEFDSTRYPDPRGMVSELHNDLHTHIMISVWPKFYVGTKHYGEFNEQGWLYMRNVEKGQRDWVGPGYVSTFYDPCSEGARELYWKQINEKLFSKGFDAWWLDCTEPDICSNLSRSETILREGPTALGSASRYLNTYSLMNCQAVYEGQRKVNPDQRVFILTRSAFAGQQRYPAATWSGDVAARWYDLKAQISAGLNFCLSGIPYWTTDIGGFAVEQRYEHPNDSDLEEWRELMTRWFQFGAFCPVFRVHGQFPYREMFNVAPDDHSAYQSMLAYDKLRYRLMPYIYSLTGSVTQNDYTIMRALILDSGCDKKVHNIGDQFMFGPALLVNPVTEYEARTRSVYLPSGTGWYDLRSGRHFKGGQTIEADAPYKEIPVFVKEGSIVPCGPEIQYATEKPADPVRLFVYTGSDGSFTLYEDEDVNYNYEKGEFSTIPLSYSEKDRTLTIGQRQGIFPGMLETRTFEVVWIGARKPSGLDFQSRPDTAVTYNGTQQSIKME
jgi:alpha-D-xyloside xylohydrolase